MKYEFCGNIVISFTKWDPLLNVLSNHQLPFISFFVLFLSFFLLLFISASLFLLFFLSSSLQAWFALSFPFFSFFLLLFMPIALFLLFFLSSLFLPLLTSSNMSSLFILSKSKPQGWSLQLCQAKNDCHTIFFSLFPRWIGVLLQQLKLKLSNFFPNANKNRLILLKKKWSRKQKIKWVLCKNE